MARKILMIDFDKEELKDYMVLASYGGYENLDELIKTLLNESVIDYFGNKDKLREYRIKLLE